MTIVPITSDTPVCMGVMCERHGTCARYLRVDGSKPETHRIATCDDRGTGERPLFVQHQREEVAA